MKRCPQCNRTKHYRLRDGRLKCSSCGQRFSWTPAWDSVRLPSSTKQRLLDLFVLGVPSYRQRFASDTSAVSRERFHRLLRACCAKVEDLHEQFDEMPWIDGEYGGMRVRPRSRLSKAIVVGLAIDQGRIRAWPAGASELLCNELVDEAALHDAASLRGHTVLRLRGKHIAIGKDKAQRPGRNHIDGIDGFWSFARTWLHRSVPRQYFHLYLAEICYRYNHRDEDIKPLMLTLLKTMSIQELRPIMVRKG